MTNVAKFVIPLLLLAVGGGAFFLLNREADAPPVPVRQDPPPAPVTPDEPKVVPATAPTPIVQDPGRTAVSGDLGASHGDAPQGVSGRVLLPNGAPAAGVQVLLLENVMNDMTQIFLANRMGKITPPVAATTTGADGTFRLGVRKLGKLVDLRILSEAHPEYQRQSIKVREGDWYDTGDLTLDIGLLVQGRVIDAANKAAIANATVYLANSSQSHTMISAPGRERGVPTTTDAGGNFRFTNGPRTGLVNVIAEAPGYASTQLLNQMLKQDGNNAFTLELDAGQPIGGIVIDQEGKPLANITINATGLSVKTPQTATTVSDSDGVFLFPTLRAGPYQLTTMAPQFLDMKPQLALTGETEVKLVLSARAAVKLKVLAANGQPVKEYRLGLKRHFPQNPANIGNVMDWPDRSISPRDYPGEFDGEWAVVRGVPTGDFRFQITDRNHAKTLSEPFTVTEGGPVVEVVATLTLGATITGTVIDDRGQPVADATVTTDMNGGLAADTGLFDFFRTMMPEKHSKMTAKTDAQGRFRISRLSFADYMIRASHPRFCEGTAINLKLENEGQVVDAGVIQLVLGAVVEGVAMVGGQPAGQVKIMLSTPMTAETLPSAGPGKPGQPSTAPGQPPRILFNATVHSDGDGRFRLLKRVPPGTYKATAQRPGSGTDPFGALMDMKESEQQVTVAPGQETVTLTFNLPKR